MTLQHIVLFSFPSRLSAEDEAHLSRYLAVILFKAQLTVAVGTAIAGGPPAQIPASGIAALGSCYEYLAANRTSGHGCLVLVGGR